MTDHEKILKMIEEVSPDDTAKLDEIDARIFCLRNGIDPDSTEELGVPDWTTRNAPQYTRSRDAIRSIWPERKFTYKLVNDNWKTFGCFLVFWFGSGEHPLGMKQFISKYIPTMELAELHAIIQAIAYERSTDAA